MLLTEFQITGENLQRLGRLGCRKRGNYAHHDWKQTAAEEGEHEEERAEGRTAGRLRDQDRLEQEERRGRLGCFKFKIIIRINIPDAHLCPRM